MKALQLLYEANKKYFKEGDIEYSLIDYSDDDNSPDLINLELRCDPNLIKIVEKLGIEANGNSSNLGIMEIPDGSFFTISNHDGLKTLFFSKEKIFVKRYL